MTRAHVALWGPLPTSVAQDRKANSREAPRAGGHLLLVVECFPNIGMMEMDKRPRNDKAFPGAGPTSKTHSWAVSPGVLPVPWLPIVSQVEGSRRLIYLSVFSALSPLRFSQAG